jgi:hypothetical protein
MWLSGLEACLREAVGPMVVLVCGCPDGQNERFKCELFAYL